MTSLLPCSWRWVPWGTWGDLAEHKFFVPTDSLEYLLSLARDTTARVVPRLKDLTMSLRVAVVSATLPRTREMGRVIGPRAGHKLNEPLAAPGKRGRQAAGDEHAAEILHHHTVRIPRGGSRRRGHDEGQHAPQLPPDVSNVPPKRGERRRELDPAAGSLHELVVGHA